jgi:hypothetical protein
MQGTSTISKYQFLAHLIPVLPSTNPITGIAGCCAPGHAAALLKLTAKHDIPIRIDAMNL